MDPLRFVRRILDWILGRLRIYVHVTVIDRDPEPVEDTDPYIRPIRVDELPPRPPHEEPTRPYIMIPEHLRQVPDIPDPANPEDDPDPESLDDET